MNTFLWTIIVLLCIESIGKLCWLATGDIPDRRPAVVALDIVGSVILLVWAIWLLK